MTTASPSDTLLRVFIGEADKISHTPLYEAIVRAARSAGLAGATVWRGVLSYGHSSHIHTTKILEFSTDLPMVVEIVDEADKIERFLPELQTLFEQANSDGLVTLEQVRSIHFRQGRRLG